MALFSSPTSIYSHRVRFVLAEKGINVEVVDVDPSNPPEDLIDLNPYQTIPTLLDRDLVLYDVGVITDYLDERYPHPPLMPVDPVSRARLRLAMFRLIKDWYPLVDALEEAVNDKTRLIFLTNPNNPSGALMSGAELREVVRIAERVGAWLLVDEVYAGLEWDAARTPSVAGLYPRGITTGSVSKALGLQGLRTGWLICPDPDLVWDAVILRENSSEIMNIMGEVIAEIALRPERLAPALAKAKHEGRENLARLDRFVAEEQKLSWQRPRAGLIGLARLVEGIDGDAFANRLLA